jgi:hypothetical protein
MGPLPPVLLFFTKKLLSAKGDFLTIPISYAPTSSEGFSIVKV